MKSIILAAGKGKRLLSEQFDAPKVLRKANDKSLIEYVIDNTDFIPKNDTTIVVGYKKEMVMQQLGSGYTYAVQEEQKGTGHAVMMASGEFKNYGDMPLFKKSTYQQLIDVHTSSGADCTILTSVTDDKLAYGRIIRTNGEITDIVEDKDCTPEQKEIKELNVGVYVFKSRLLFDNLSKLKNNNAQGEYYLTDVPKILIDEGKKVASFTTYDQHEIIGVNTPEDLAFVETLLTERENIND